MRARGTCRPPAVRTCVATNELSHAASCRLSELPRNLGDWANLRTLALSHNRLQQLPPSLSSLVSLERLDAGHNRLAALPAGLDGLPRLEQLLLHSNELAAAPDGLAALTGLTELDLSSNRLVPGGVDAGVLFALTALGSLRLGGNAGLFADGRSSDQQQQLSELGTEGQPVPTAQQQAWRDAWLRGVRPPMGEGSAAPSPGSGVRAAQAAAGAGSSGRGPPCAASTGGGAAPGQLLPLLRHLDLSGTRLGVLPTWLPVGLTELRAAGNGVREVPQWLCARLAGTLFALDLRRNPIERVPKDATHLLQLHVLLLEGCPCASPEACAGPIGSSGAAPRGSRASSAMAVGGSGGGGPDRDFVPPEDSAAWVAGWLMARKAGRPWPPSVRHLAPALLAAAGVPELLPEPSSSGRRPAQPPLSPSFSPQRQEQMPAGGDAPSGAFGGGRRRAAIFVSGPGNE